MISKKIGLLIVFLTLTASMMAGGEGLIYFDLLAFLLVLGVLIGCLVAVFGFSPLFQLKTDEQRAHFYHVAKLSSLFSGFLGLVIGFFTIVVFLSDVESFGPAVAVGLLSYLYSSLCFLFFTLRGWQAQFLED